MNKLTTLTVIAGLMTALSTVSPQAAFILQNKNPNQIHVPNENNCAAEMGHMRSVRPAEIATVAHQPIVLIAVCEDLSVPGRNAYGSLFIEGNAELLRLPIARNGELMSVLGAKDYDQNDVVSVRFGGNDSVILYVYQRDMN